MHTRIRLLSVVLSLAALSLVATSAAAEVTGVVLGDSSVSAAAADEVTTAKVRLINTGNTQQRLPEVAVVLNRSTCQPSLIDVANRTLPARATSVVSVVFPSNCFSDSVDLIVDLDADNRERSLPPVTVKPPKPTSQPPWRALAIGGILGAIIFSTLTISGELSRRLTVKEIESKAEIRAARYSVVQQVVNRRMAELIGVPTDEHGWKLDAHGNLEVSDAAWVSVLLKNKVPSLVTTSVSTGTKPPSLPNRTFDELRVLVDLGDMQIVCTSDGNPLIHEGFPIIGPKGSRPVFDKPGVFSGKLAKPILAWEPLKKPTFRYRDEVGNLAAGWSFKDSWVSNLTVGTTAFVAISTSVDAFTTFLGEAPKAMLGVMTVAGLISGVLIALAITLSKLFGASSEKVSVFGLILATALTAGAAGLQTGTLGVAAAIAFGLPNGWPGVGSPPALAGVSLVLGAVVAIVLTAYAIRSLHGLLKGGYYDNVPAVPDDALKSWDVDPSSAWQKQYVEQRIRTAFSKWLSDAEQPLTPIGSELPSMAGGRQTAFLIDGLSGQFRPEMQKSML